jgi:hypothetical protein
LGDALGQQEVVVVEAHAQHHWHFECGLGEGCVRQELEQQKPHQGEERYGEWPE